MRILVAYVSCNLLFMSLVTCDSMQDIRISPSTVLLSVILGPYNNALKNAVGNQAYTVVTSVWNTITKSIYFLLNFEYESVIMQKNLKTIDENIHTNLVIGAYNGNFELVNSLLESNFSFREDSAQNGDIPLLLASSLGHENIVDLLLKYKYNLRISPRNLTQAFIYAAYNGHKKTVEMFIKYDTNPNEANENDINPFLSAVYANNNEIVKLLLYHSQGNQKRRIEKNTLLTALRYATSENNTVIVDLILKYELITDDTFLVFTNHQYAIIEVYLKYIDVNAEIINNFTLLHYFAYMGDNLNIEFLLKRNVDVNKMHHPSGITSLALATYNGHLSTVVLLLKNGASINNDDVYGINAQCIAAEFGYEELVQQFLNFGANLNNLEERKCNALSLAAYKGHVNIVRMLLKHNAIVDHQDNNGNTPLMFAAQQGYTNILKLLLQYGADVNKQNKYKYNALMLAILSGNISTVKLLLKYNAGINQVTIDGKTALMLAVEIGNSYIVNLLLQHGANINTLNQWSQSALMIATLNGNISIVNTLLKHKARMDIVSYTGDTAFTYAIQKRNFELIDMFLQHGADINDLHYSIWAAFEQAVLSGKIATIDQNLNKNRRHNNDIDLFFYSIILHLGYYKFAKLFLPHVNDINQGIEDKNVTALMLASSTGHIRTVELLLERNARVNDTNADGNSALFWASGQGHIHVVEMLLKYNADVNKQNNEKFTALMVASFNGHTNAVELLLKNGARVDDTGKYGVTALMFAVARNDSTSCELLLKHGANISMMNNKNYTALTMASWEGHTSIVKMFLQHMTKNQSVCVSVKESLMFALINGRSKTVKLLLSYVQEQSNLIHNLTSKSSQDLIQSGKITMQPYYVTLMEFVQEQRRGLSDIRGVFFLLIVLIFLTISIAKISYNYTDRKLETKLLYRDNLFDMIKGPIVVKNVWCCDKTCQPNESGFFRLLNFRGKLHSLTHVQEVSPNCSGCLVTSGSDERNTEANTICLECIVLQEYITYIINYINGKLYLDELSSEEVETFRSNYNILIELRASLKAVIHSHPSTPNLFLQLMRLKPKLQVISRYCLQDSQSTITLTEPQVICSMFGLNKLFENYLLELDMESINHQTLEFYLNKWLKNTIQAVEESNPSMSLHDCMLRVGLSEDIARSYVETLTEEFINMYTSLYWISRYFKNIFSVNPLLTTLPLSCVFEGEIGRWKSCDVQRDGMAFKINILNYKSFPKDNRDEHNQTCTKIKRYLKNKKRAGCVYLYHGTSLTSAENIVVYRGIDLSQGSRNLDFSHGKGFYLTNSLAKCVEWSSNNRPQHHAVIIYRINEKEIEERKGLVLEDEEQWRRVVKACRSGFAGDVGSDVEDELEKMDYIRGYICSNGRASQNMATFNPEIMEDRNGETPNRPLQTCIISKKCAQWFNSPSNIFGVVVYRTL